MAFAVSKCMSIKGSNHLILYAGIHETLKSFLLALLLQIEFYKATVLDYHSFLSMGIPED